MKYNDFKTWSSACKKRGVTHYGYALDNCVDALRDYLLIGLWDDDKSIGYIYN